MDCSDESINYRKSLKCTHSGLRVKGDGDRVIYRRDKKDKNLY